MGWLPAFYMVKLEASLPLLSILLLPLCALNMLAAATASSITSTLKYALYSSMFYTAALRPTLL
jgi:hypothetical protein